MEKENMPDCCKSGKQPGDGKGNAMGFIAAILGILLVISILQAFQISALKSIPTGNAVNAIAGGAAGTAGGINMAGWTEDEKMMYEHHGTLPARLEQAPASSQAQMVGGC